MKIINRIAILAYLGILITSCNSRKVKANENFLIDSDGFIDRVTIQEINVKELDKNGIPKIYDEVELTRVDLINDGTNVIQDMIWFYKPNKGYYWQSNMTEGKFSIMPLKFEEN